MPFIVEVDGHRHQIDQGDQRLQTLNMDMERKVQIRTEYRFKIPSIEVRVLTYEAPMASYLTESETYVPEQVKLVDDRLHHIREFLIQDGDDPYQRPITRVKIPEEMYEEMDKYRGSFGYIKPYPPKPYPQVSSEERERQKRSAGSLYRDPVPKEVFGKKSSILNPGNASTEKESRMFGLVTGTRVQIPDPLGKERYATATVIEMKEGWPKGKVLLCLDRPQNEEGHASETTGNGYGYLAHADHIRPLGPVRSAVDRYSSVPDHIGVVAPEGFKEIPKNAVGRVLSLNDNQATVAWFNVRHPAFRQETDGKRVWESVWTIPAEPLRWCRLEPGTHKVKRTFYTTFSAFERGDYLVYISEKPVSLPGGAGKSNYVVTPGVVFQHQGWDSDHCCIRGMIVAGMSPEIIGTNLNLRKQDVRKFEGVFLSAGATVEIIAEVVFKKSNLQGRRAHVVLPTDGDGDVGIEFTEDLGAGSLDGVGQEGRCLYVPAQAVKLISE